MGIVFFATSSFEFFFQKNSSNLEMWDPYHLPFSKKFLYSVYHRRVPDPPLLHSSFIFHERHQCLIDS